MLWVQDQGWEIEEDSSAGASGMSATRQTFLIDGQCLALDQPLGMNPEPSWDRWLSQLSQRHVQGGLCGGVRRCLDHLTFYKYR